jgi:hypothetical protein
LHDKNSFGEKLKPLETAKFKEQMKKKKDRELADIVITAR